MAIIDASEMDDFKMVLKRYGYEEQDFTLEEVEHPPRSMGVESICGEVAITHEKTGKHKTYNAGDRTAWVYEFENDLKAGVFTA